MSTDTEEVARTDGLATKLARIYGQLERIEKTHTNSEFGYRYASVEDLLDVVRSALAEHGVALIPSLPADQVVREPTGSKTRAGRPWLRYVVPITYTLVDGDTGEVLVIPWVGEAEDYSDKGLAKAQTSAIKTFMRATFLISTGDLSDEADADRGGEHVPADQQQPRRSQQRAAVDPSSPATAAQRALIRTRATDSEVDDDTLRSLLTYLSGGKVTTVDDVYDGLVGRVLNGIGYYARNTEEAEAAMRDWFAEHPEHRFEPTSEALPDDSDVPTQAELDRQAAEAAADDDVPF